MKLAPKDAANLDALIREHGFDGAANYLRVSPPLVNKLAYGGGASADSVRRMTDALAKRALHLLMERTAAHGDKAAV